MRKSIAIAATLVAGASATTIGAANGIPTQYFGSDTLFVVTQDAIGATPTLGLSLEPNYLAGGSGAGQNAMATTSVAAEKQQTAPMSKQMTNGLCNKLGGTNGSANTNATGIVIGMDAVDLLSSATAGGTTACNGASDNASADGTGFGAAFSGSTAVFSSTTGQNWKWVLALLYGGLDLSPTGSATPNCSSQARLSLVSNWSHLFQTGCSNPNTVCNDPAHEACTTNADCPVSGTSCNTGGTGALKNTCVVTGSSPLVAPPASLWHAFRRDDASGTSDVFSALIGLQTWIGGGPSASSNNGFGLSPYCNAMNWDANLATNGNGTVVNCAGTAGSDDQFVGPGGVPDTSSLCNFTDFKPADLKAAETCVAAGTVCNSTTACPAGFTCSSTTATNGTCFGNHKAPPAKAWGSAPDPNLGGAVNGFASFDVLPTSFQDNDPLRRPCLGTGAGSPFASAEEVCNTDGKLGVVLAIPSSDFIPTTTNHPVQYPSNACTGTYFEGDAPKIINCGPQSGSSTHPGQCPNGDSFFASNKCAVPVDDSNPSAVTSQCLNSKTPTAPIKERPSTIAADARVHNMAMYDGTVVGKKPVFILDTIQNGATPPAVSMMGGMGRIHTVATIFNTALNSGNPANVGCELSDATDNINCLVQSDPCSVGYAGDGGKSFSERANGACTFLTTANGGNLCAVSGSGFVNGSGGPCPAACLSVGTTTAAVVSESVRIDQVYPNASAVLALGSTTTTEYQVGRKLYFNSIVGFNAIADTTNDPGATGELALAEFEGVEANIAPILTPIGYFPLAGSNPTTGTDPAGVPFNAFNAPFCEDFNEQTVCNPNTNRCNSTTACPTGQTCTSTTAAFGNCGPTCSSSTPCPTGANFVCSSTTTTNGACLLAANVFACGGNASATAEYTGAVAPPSVGPVCGDGKIDPFEECDDGLLNGTGGDNCSVTCRCSGTTSFSSTTHTCQ